MRGPSKTQFEVRIAGKSPFACGQLDCGRPRYHPHPRHQRQRRDRSCEAFRRRHSGDYKVTVNKEIQYVRGSFIQSIEISGRDGNDQITIGDSVTIPAYISAGKGNDIVQGGSGDDVILGEGGSDVLLGGTGDDLIDGGGGADDIHGAGDDIVTGGKGNDFIHRGALVTIP